MNERLLGLLAAISLVLLFACFTVFSRFALVTNLQPMDLVALRYGISGLILAPFLLRRGLGGIALKDALILSFFGGVAFGVLGYSGLKYAPAAHGAVLMHGMLPFFGILIGSFLLKEPITRQRIIGGGLIVVGVVFLITESTTAFSPMVLLGDLLLLGGSACWSSYGANLKRLGLDGFTGATIVAPISMVLILPVYFLFLEPGIYDASATDVLLQAVFQGVLMGIVGLVIYGISVKLLGATETTVAVAAAPPVATILAIPVLAEWPSLLACLGVASVSIGVVIAVRRKKPEALKALA